MDLRLYPPLEIANTHIAIGGSKSVTNRLLLLQALFSGFSIINGSSSDDSEVMVKALKGDSKLIDIHHAGTAMRFLTAYFAIQEGREAVLTGSKRMKERPIAVLVDALRGLGADIEYVENDGFPPLKIKGKNLDGGHVSIPANVSSQYITALLLIAGKLENGLQLTLEGEITSQPYIEMTLSLLQQIGIKTTFDGNSIDVRPAENLKSEFCNLIEVESDWSSASYFYSMVALSPEGTSTKLSSFRQDSLQGDSALQHIYKDLGVVTEFVENAITIRRTNFKRQALNINLIETPDLAQTAVVTCFGLGVGCHLTGLHTLKIKETDRLAALKTELEKLRAEVEITDDRLTLAPHDLFSARALGSGSLSFEESTEVRLDTYNDHRMAMAFAPLALKMPLIIKDAGVVAKSYPTFWEDLKKLGFDVEEI